MSEGNDWVTTRLESQPENGPDCCEDVQRFSSCSTLRPDAQCLVKKQLAETSGELFTGGSQLERWTSNYFNHYGCLRR